MNKEEFLRQLNQLLVSVPESERLDAVAYYRDYFEEAGTENEQEVIRELGSPRKVAESIKENLRASGFERTRDYSAPEEEENSYDSQYDDESQSNYNEQSNYDTQESYQQNSNNTGTKKQSKASVIIIAVIIAILTFPIWIGIVAGLFGAVVGVLAGLFGVVVGLGGSAIGLTVGGVALMVGGIAAMGVSLAEGLIITGVGAILAAIGLLLGLLIVWIAGVWIPRLVRVIAKWCRQTFRKKEGGNEI